MEYLVVKWLHVVSSTILFGTGVGSAYYMLMAGLRGRPAEVHFVARHVVIADWIFTATAVVVQPLTGLWLANAAGLPLSTNPLVFLLIVNVLLLVVGCFMEALAAMLVLIPILVPTAIKLGIDPVQFGLVFVLNLMIGTITPPVGVVLFVTAKVADVPFDRLARATVPYLWALIAVLALITVWPAVTTFLPNLLLEK